MRCSIIEKSCTPANENTAHIPPFKKRSAHLSDASSTSSSERIPREKMSILVKPKVIRKQTKTKQKKQREKNIGDVRREALGIEALGIGPH